MTTAQAFQTLQQSIRPGTPQEAALRKLRGTFAKQSEIRSTDQTMYLRLYAWAFHQLLVHYKATPEDKIPQSELHRILDTRWERHCEAIATHSNMLDLERTLKEYNRPPTGEYSPQEVSQNLRHQALEAILAYTEAKRDPQTETSPL